MSNLFDKPKVGVSEDTGKEDADKAIKKRRRRLRRSQESFQARVASLGPIQLQAPGLGGL